MLLTIWHLIEPYAIPTLTAIAGYIARILHVKITVSTTADTTATK